MSPNDEAESRDGNRAVGDHLVAEDVLAAEGRDELTDHAHGRQDHDVDRRVRVEPEEVLVEHGIAAQSRVEDADAERALRDQSSTVMPSTGVASTCMMAVA